ncbi:MAG: nucleotidyltransferase domain-containing protein [Thermoanaerobaculia bacterium]
MDELERQIRDAVADIPGIAALLLFGSRARGTARPDSDLDLAVLPTAAEPSGRSVRHRKPLERARRLPRQARELPATQS